MDRLKFTCPKCSHDVVRRIEGTTKMRCARCKHEANPAGFWLEKRHSQKWDEAVEVKPYE